jgi:hypothetical protein
MEISPLPAINQWSGFNHFAIISEVFIMSIAKAHSLKQVYQMLNSGNTVKSNWRSM